MILLLEMQDWHIPLEKIYGEKKKPRPIEAFFFVGPCEEKKTRGMEKREEEEETDRWRELHLLKKGDNVIIRMEERPISVINCAWIFWFFFFFHMVHSLQKKKKKKGMYPHTHIPTPTDTSLTPRKISSIINSL